MHPKAKTYALSFIENHLRYCTTDCSDSMHEAESAKDKFGAVTDEANLTDFIKEHLMVEYADAMIAALKENGETLDSEGTFGVAKPLISVKEVKDFVGTVRK